MGRIAAAAHRAGRATTHTNAHAWAAQLDQQSACGEWDFVGELGINRAQAAGNHNRLVVPHLTRLHAVGSMGHYSLLVLAEVASQIGATKFVVKRRTAQWAFHHDLQWAGNVLRLATGLVAPAIPQFRHGKTS